jgi:hypothetical protein
VTCSVGVRGKTVSRRTYLVFESLNQCHLACTKCFARFAKMVYDSSFSRFKVTRTLVLHFTFELPVYLNAITVFNGASAAQRSTHDWCARWLMTGKSQNHIPRLNSVFPTRILTSLHSFVLFYFIGCDDMVPCHHTRASERIYASPSPVSKSSEQLSTITVSTRYLSYRPLQILHQSSPTI